MSSPLEVVLTAAAVADLSDLWSWIAADDPAAADRFTESLQTKAIALGANPRMGRRREDLGPGVRSFPFRRYVILYRVTAEKLQVPRIVSGYRDLEGLS